jgi:membrane associated rhomboid family serine protease
MHQPYYVDPTTQTATMPWVRLHSVKGYLDMISVIEDYPRVRVKYLFIFIIFFKVFRLPAWAVLLWWFGMQVLTGLPQLNQVDPEVSGGVAVWAHVGGFVAGVLLIKLFENRRLVSRRTLVADAHRTLLKGGIFACN